MNTEAQQVADEQMEDPLLRCGTCGEPVIVFDARFFRTCEHLEAVIVATDKAARALTNANI
ncbi:hypothetical protein UFOVP313_3 [uncultured Caudovirales phage]|jgi:hypothetical protein|uniref:Uncharacterized protein n=1 Tax=uncultured Caudovirales phage TaxID=2100421 RepID=A0A6J5LYP3_9CAUD|nr:hypothetical protein UFOVP313_3 [uncultured Caudovirales phage]